MVAVLLGTVASGCRSGSDGFPDGNALPRPIRLQVENNNYLDVTVYAKGSGISYKVGYVTGKSSGTLTIDPRRVSLASGLQLRVDPLGSTQTYLSPVLFPDPSATLVLIVGAELESSRITFR